MMAAQQPSGGIFRSPQAARLLKDKAAVERLTQSPDAKALMEMLQRKGGLQAAAGAAMKGDASQLQGLLSQLMQDPEGAKVVERLNRSAPKS